MPTDHSAPRLRPAHADDVDALAARSGELGYPSDPAQLAGRLATLLAAPEQHFVCVVEVNGTVCGWIHGLVRPRLESDTRVEIGGLVVGAAWRGQGLGAALLEAGEQWARAASAASPCAAPNTAATRTASTCARATATSRPS